MSEPSKVLEVNPEAQDLDDVLLAMDVVDTLRHRERVVARELDAEGREKELIARLKEIYAAQGMQVPERILREGVQALEEDRFKYTPPEGGLSVRLAKIYITRDRWLKPVAGAIAALAAMWGIYEFGVSRPAEARAEKARLLMSETLPSELDTALANLREVTDNREALDVATSYHTTGITATQLGNEARAREAIAKLQQLQSDVSMTYEVRVVYTGGRDSGRTRAHEDNPGVTNYYLLVEAIAPSGEVLTVPIRSEETGEVKRVSMWGQRVSEAVYNRVAADKMDDRIIQEAKIGEKALGDLRPVYSVDTPGGAILEW